MRRIGKRAKLTVLLGLAACWGGCAHISADGKGVDGQRALDHAASILRVGPHPPGSAAQRQVGLYLIQQLKAAGLEVKTQAFTPVTPEGPLEMVNIWGVLPGEREDVLIIASHYDSKLFRDFTFVGANDPAASCGLVLELARALSAHNPTPLTLWFVFFDGEEALRNWSETDSLYGSRHFVRALARSQELGRVRAMVLLDLIGGNPLHLYREANSTPWMNAIIWEQARELGFTGVFIPSGSTTVEDDHVPFLEAGIPSVDLIDLGYPHWHSASDTLDKLSHESLRTVGEVVVAALPKIARRLPRE